MKTRLKFSVTLAAELEALERFESFIIDTCGELDIETHVRDNLTKAVRDVCKTIIDVGYAGLDSGSIIVSMVKQSSNVVVTITDFGNPLDPLSKLMSNVGQAIEDLPMGGFGLAFLFRTMQNIKYEVTQAGNRLIFSHPFQRNKTE